MSLPKLSAKYKQLLNFLADFSIHILYYPGKPNILPIVLPWQPAPPTDARPCGDASLSSMVLEPILLTKVYWGLLSDVTLGPFVEKAKSSDSEFVVRWVHSLPLLYHRPITVVYLLAIPDGLGFALIMVRRGPLYTSCWSHGRL